MPLTTPEGVRVPSGDDPYDLTTDLRKMAETTIAVIPVVNATARATLLANLAAAGRPASPTRPVYVHQGDTGTTWKNDGSGWRAVGVPDVIAPENAPASGQTFDSKLILSVLIPAAPFARRLVVNGTVYGSAITGSWDGALSVDQIQVDNAQRYARFPTGVAAASVSMAMTHNLAANSASTARLWVRRLGAAGTVLTTAAAPQYTNLDVQVFQL